MKGITMKLSHMIVSMITISMVLPTSANYKLEDMKDPATEGPETIAHPNCLKIQQECKGSSVDIKKKEAYERCVQKQVSSFCNTTYGREAQAGLYQSCMSAQCGQNSRAIEDPINPADTKTGVRAQEDRVPIPDQEGHVAQPKNRVIAIEKNAKGQKLIAPFDVNTAKSRKEQKEK